MTEKREAKGWGATGTAMFAGLPRRRWTGVALLAAWFVMVALFAGDLVPTASPGDWLYGVEARRDANARALEREKAARDAPRPAAPVVASAS